MRLGIDTGGTYTDAVLFNDGRVVASAKSLTTKHDLALGIGAATEQILAGQNSARVDLVSISTTLATNAIVEGHGHTIGLILIGQKPSALGRSGLNLALGEDPVVFVGGGHTAGGEEQTPLDEAAITTSITELQSQVSAYAVAGHFAVRNPAHEIRVRDLIRELTDRPVTCSHELSSKLDVPRRALTAVLNARLIPLIQALILAVEATLEQHAIQAPLMVVKGDGSLISAEVALERPVETILSGPAASLIGAHHLCGRDDVIVADIGGTTTDIAIMQDGRPRLSQQGANVAGWRTMVEAAEIYTVGLGGDSEVGYEDANILKVGPQRCMPISLLASQHANVLTVLRRQLEAGPNPDAGRFVLRQRSLPTTGEAGLSTPEQRLWARLADGPLPVTELLDDPRVERPLRRLRAKGLIVVAALTPSDAAHVLGHHCGWSTEAARIAATLWRRTRNGSEFASDEALCTAIRECVIQQSAQALVLAALAGEAEPVNCKSKRDSLGDVLLRRGAGNNTADTLVEIGLKLRVPLAAVGAPASTYYPEIAARVGAECVIPDHAAVCNAIGAVASGIVQRVSGLITAPSDDCFRVHLPSGIRDFRALEDAADYARDEASRLARQQAAHAGSEQIEIVTDRQDTLVSGFGGQKTFIESTVIATAAGRPRLG